MEDDPEREIESKEKFVKPVAKYPKTEKQTTRDYNGQNEDEGEYVDLTKLTK